MRPITEERLMIRPERWRSIVRWKACMSRNAPRRFVFITSSQSCAVMRIERPSRVTPALFTRMSQRSRCLMMSVAHSTTDWGSETSAA